MCTAATYQTRDFYMGRTLDYEFSYGEEFFEEVDDAVPGELPVAHDALAEEQHHDHNDHREHQHTEAAAHEWDVHTQICLLYTSRCV